MNAPLRLTRAITMAVCIALPCVSQGADAPKPKELARGRYLVTSGPRAIRRPPICRRTRSRSRLSCSSPRRRSNGQSQRRVEK